MNLPPGSNPLTRARTWVQSNRAQAQIAAIAGLAIGLIIIMFIVTVVIIVRTLR